MLTESIVLAVFICSIGGILLILIRKIPALNSLPQNGGIGIKKHQIVLDTEIKIKEILISFEKQVFLHKLLSWTKVMTLKIETRIDVLLRRIRKKAQQIDKEANNKKIDLPK
jgi:hypothetical protein